MVKAFKKLKALCGCGCGNGPDSEAGTTATPENPTAADRLEAALRQIDRMAGFWETFEREDGLTPAQRRTLETLCVSSHNSCTCNKLAEDTGVSASTLTRHIDPLVEAGLVERKEGDDRRIVYLCCTRPGKESAEKIRERKQAFFDEILAGIPEERRDTVLDALEELIRAFEKSQPKKCC